MAARPPRPVCCAPAAGALAAVLAALAAPAQAQPQTGPEPPPAPVAAPPPPARVAPGPAVAFTLVAAADVDGRLAEPDCRAPAPPAPALARLAASVALARAGAEAQGRVVLPPVFLGDFTGPAALGRYVIEEGGGAPALAALVARSGFAYTALGNHWIDQPPAVQATLAERLAAGGPVPLAANLSCKERPDCAALGALAPHVLVRAGGVDVALAAATSEELAAAVDPDMFKGLSLSPAGAALAARAAEARKAGAGLVLGAVHVGGGRGSFSALAALRRAAVGVDLLVSNRLGELEETGAAVLPPAGPALVAAGAPAGAVVRIDFDWEPAGEGGRLTGLRAQTVAAAEPEPALAAEVGALVRRYCEAWDRPLGVHAGEPVDGGEFFRVLLDELRRASGAEVAIANHSIADPGAFPLAGRLSRADLYAALPWDDPLLRAELPGARLRALRARELGRAGGPRAAFAGFADKDGVLLVNGRPLDDAGRYWVVLPDFLARGGDGVFLEKVATQPVRAPGGLPATVRGTMLAALEERRGALREVSPPLDLSARLRFSWTGAVTLSAADTRRDNGAANPDARLAKQAASALRADATGRVDADQRDHALRLSGRMRYGRTAVGTASATESDDQIWAEALYRLRYLRRRLGERWYAPIPFAAAQLDSEFVPPAAALFHRLEAGATAGVRLAPFRPLELKAGLGARRELLDPAGRSRLGVELGWELPRFPVARLQGLPVDVESGLDYFVSDLAGDRRDEARLRARVLLPLGGPLAVSAGIDFLALRQAGAGWAWLSDATLGLTARLDGARQQF